MLKTVNLGLGQKGSLLRPNDQNQEGQLTSEYHTVIMRTIKITVRLVRVLSACCEPVYVEGAGVLLFCYRCGAALSCLCGGGVHDTISTAKIAITGPCDFRCSRDIDCMARPTE